MTIQTKHQQSVTGWDGVELKYMFPKTPENGSSIRCLNLLKI